METDGAFSERKIMKSPIKRHGGKFYLAEWIHSHFPPRDRYTHYTEAYAGSCAVLFRNDPNGLGEAINDIDGPLSHFWKCLSYSESARQLIQQLKMTAVNEGVFNEAQRILEADECSVIQSAWAFFVVCRQSRAALGKDFVVPTSRLRSGRDEHVSAWINSVDGLPEIVKRLRNVAVHWKPAEEFLRKTDHANALHYLDPPYHPDTRTAKSAYKHEMSHEDHENLLLTLSELKGKFVLSGYECDLYSEFAKRECWRMESQETRNMQSSSGRVARECLWMNY